MKKNLIVFLVVCIVAVLQISYFMKNENRSVESSEAISFVVDKVEITPASTYSFYDVEGNLFTDYTFSLAVEIMKGDIIEKDPNSNELIVYRLDQKEQKNIIFKANMQNK